MAKLFKEGIDVSAFQGKINWRMAKGSLLDFAMLRASSGFGGNDYLIDPRFYSNAHEAFDAGIPVGAYHTTMARSVDEARRDAEFFLNTIENARLDYPVALDLENRDFLKLPTYTLRDIVLAWCHEILKAGYHPLIKGRPSTLFEQLDLESRGDIGYWVSAFKSQLTRESHAIQMWQYASGAKIDGIEGYVNRNRSLPFQLYVEKESVKVIEEPPPPPPKEAKKPDLLQQAMEMLQILELVQGLSSASDIWGSLLGGKSNAAVPPAKPETSVQDDSLMPALDRLLNDLLKKPEVTNALVIEPAEIESEAKDVALIEAKPTEEEAEAITDYTVNEANPATQEETEATKNESFDENPVTMPERMVEEYPSLTEEGYETMAENDRQLRIEAETEADPDSLFPEDSDYPPVGGGEDAQDFLGLDD